MRSEVVSAAVDMCERNNVEITVANVAANVLIKPSEYQRIFDSGLKAEVAPALKRLGYVTNDAAKNTKVVIADASLSDLRQLLDIKRTHARRVQVQVDALAQLVAFMEEKEKELGYEPYVHLFEEDARRIYQMHG